jgi:CheY-like chemotaxis protein
VLSYFPVAGAGASLTRRPRELAAPRGTEAILIAEDEEGVRRSARRSLEGLGYTVAVASDGQEALDMVKSDPARFQLILTDVGMPRLGGHELYHAVRAADVAIPFIFMSAYNADDLRTTNRLPPALPFLHKPWTLTDLARRVRDVLDTVNAREAVRARTILVADNDAATRSVIRARLEEAGAVVTECRDAADAARRFRESPADLIIAGLNASATDGVSLAAELAAAFPGARILAIAHENGTAPARSGDRDEPADRRVLRRPFTSAQLLDAAAETLSRDERAPR